MPRDTGRMLRTSATKAMSVTSSKRQEAKSISFRLKEIRNRVEATWLLVPALSPAKWL